MKYTIKKLCHGLFLVSFEKHYDLAMTFLRYQENYESTKFRGEDNFTIIDYMEWYAENTGGGAFTYPADWSGFNLPAIEVKRILDSNIPDRNKYDETMSAIYSECYKLNNYGKTFYLIGADYNDLETMKHEIAHGLYAIDDSYKLKMLTLTQKINKKLYSSLSETLLRMGYNTAVIDDEIQAFLSTGLAGKIEALQKECDKYIPKYQKIYDDYYKRYIT